MDRATIDLSKLQTRQQRIEHIAKLMASGEWLMKRPQRRELAAAWGVEECTVRRYSADAHMLLTVDPDERAELRFALAARMLDIADRAKTTLSNVTGMPDFRAELDALQKHAEYAGFDMADPASAAKPMPVKVEILYAGDRPKESEDT